MSSHPVRAQYTDIEEGAEAFAKMIAPSRLVRPARLCGIFGKPYADLSELIDTSCFDDLHREITRGLTLVETSYTGGTLKWMGVCAPWVLRDPYRDAMHAIQAMSPDEIAELVALGDGEVATDASDPNLAFGDETERPFTKARAVATSDSTSRSRTARPRCPLTASSTPGFWSGSIVRYAAADRPRCPAARGILADREISQGILRCPREYGRSPHRNVCRPPLSP